MILNKFIIFDYITEHGMINHADMLLLKSKHNIGIPEQIKWLKELVDEGKVDNLTSNSSEPTFKKVQKKIDIDELTRQVSEVNLSNVIEKIFQYLHSKNGVFDEVEFFMEYGIPFDVQEKCLSMLIRDGKIEESWKGYKIKKVNA